jgi:hypothetical protein
MTAVASQYAMAWNDSADGISAVSQSYRANRCAVSERIRKLTVGAGLSLRNIAKQAPDELLKCGALPDDGKRKLPAFSSRSNRKVASEQARNPTTFVKPATLPSVLADVPAY